MRSDRLLVLAAHLKSDRRGHKIFDFATVTFGPRDEGRHGCGSAGCAFGELPVVWPEFWEFAQGLVLGSRTGLYHVRLKSHDTPDGGAGISKRAMEFFELDRDEVVALFYADRRLEEPSPIQALPFTATAEQVADRFIAFVKWREERVAQENQNAS